jgi:hypothetical protein
MHNTEQQKSAIQWCESFLKEWDNLSFMSEDIQQAILSRGGKLFKVSNLERRMRESDKILSVKVQGKNYVKYRYVGGDV